MSDRIVVSQCPSRNLQMVIDTLPYGSRITRHVPIKTGVDVKRKRIFKEKKEPEVNNNNKE